MTDMNPPTAEPADDVETLAEVIWTASRADESTISATGANHVARAVLASDWLAAERAKAKAEALREHRRRVLRFMPPGLVDRATVVADLEDYAHRLADAPREAQDGGGER